MKTVLAHGTFDILHIGHLDYLKYCKRLGDKVIVGLSSDKMTQLRKGENRPIVPFRDRASLIRGMKYVDEVVEVPFVDNDFVYNLFLFVLDRRPDIFVTSYDEFNKYRGDFVKKGIELYIRNVPPIYSSTEIIERIIERYTK